MKSASPITYYGGKSNLVREILPLIPQHIQYVEPFFGSGVVMFSKPQSKNEVINDLNTHVTNFFWQLKTNFYELQKMIHATLHSEILYTKAKEILRDENSSDLDRAWAFWVGTNCAFGHVLFGGFAFGLTGSGLGTKNKRDNFTEKYSKRLERCEIFNRDAVELIQLKDDVNTFFYVDPPYVSSECRHYKGYTESDFINLLNCLQNIKGKFLMSSYPEKVLMQYREECSVEKLGEEKGWRFKDIEQTVLVSGKREIPKMKTECLTYNYPTPANQASLFGDTLSIELLEIENEVEEENNN